MSDLQGVSFKIIYARNSEKQPKIVADEVITQSMVKNILGCSSSS